MPTRLLRHLRQNLVAYLALFVALGGTSYAAFNLPANSVGARQIRNHSIDPVKLNPKTISASIRAWVIVFADSTTASAGSSSARVRVHAIGTGEVITWPGRRFARNCLASVTPQVQVSSGGPGSVSADFRPAQGMLTLYGFGPDKVGRPQAAFVMIVCP